ncbi:MAG: efflux RND transporter permease subunit, partial [Tannerellaceae bacterium]|nr:efflux RND transporter permease subunit [Tannerellaceae bacterium]
MRDIGRWALANRKLINFLMMVMVVGGAYSFYDMNKLEDPEIKVKLAVIATTYPGASAHQVELEVTDVLEKSIRSMKEVSSVTSRSMNDVSIISVNLSTLVKNDRVDECWDILRRKVSDAAGSLPQGASSPVVMDDFGDVYGIFYALTSDGFSGDELGDYAELIKREVQEVDGVARVNIYAKQDKCINIELSQERMAMLGVHPAEALLTLSGQGKTVYPGYYESEGRRLRITVGDGLTTIDDIKNLLIQGHENDQVRLGDIALVGQGYEKPVRSGMRYDGQQAVGIAIAALSGTDITKVGDKVEERLGRLSGERLPAGISLHKVFYQPERVRDALGDFMINLIESIVIVVGILMLTMGFRSGVVIGTSLFVVVAGSFLLLNMFDGTLQRVSLASFVLAMGMLVDNAIVIIDGILVDLKRGKGRREALTAIGRKTAMPLLAATMIAVLAFLPIFLSPDTSGIYVRDLFIVLAVSLLLSWALALTQVPIQANAMLPLRFGGGGGAGSNKTGCAGGLFDSRPYHMLRRVLSWGLRHRMTAVGAAVVMVCGSFFGLSLLPRGF